MAAYKALNDVNVFSSQTVLTESGPVAGKAACNILANTYKNVSEVDIPRGRIQVFQQDTKEVQNIDVPSTLACWIS